MRYARIDRVDDEDGTEAEIALLKKHIGESFEVIEQWPDGTAQIKIEKRKVLLDSEEHTDMELCPKCQALFEYKHGSRTIVCPQGHEYANEREE